MLTLTDPNSQIIFKQYETDNIMDYSDVGSKKIEVNRTAHWQWNILKSSANRYNAMEIIADWMDWIK